MDELYGPPRGTILIVDDVADCVITLEEACAAVPGVGVLVAKSALEAVRALQDSGNRICAVITDIRMPGMNGFDLIRFMRADERHAATPIIVVTADTDPETPERASSLGANAFFYKPFSPAEIRRALSELLDETRLSQ